MPPRPKGTDGSDHAYRMVIAERYQRMADFKYSIVRLLASHVTLCVVKCAVAAWLGGLEGVPLSPQEVGIVGGEVAVVVLFTAAKLGNVKESLALLKTYNVLQAFVAGMHVLTAWRYYNGLDTEEGRYSKIAVRAIMTRSPGYKLATVDTVVRSTELALDLTLGAFLILCTAVSHRMIKEKMDLKAEAAAKGAAKRGAEAGGVGGGGSGGGAADDEEPPEAVPLEEEKLVTAKASMRRRARIA